mmetsp:Transcript_10745/g.19877  ORF Transcript_10745/g.19877 Transcript_10745/m.19877 type:complete len:551 (-) Transcript_10745:87-1739(-)
MSMRRGPASAGHPVASTARAFLCALLVWPVLSLKSHQEYYTTNAICSKKNCINPIFPGMEDMHQLSNSRWLCSTLHSVQKSMGFCKAAVTYDPALPAPEGGSAPIETLVQRQDNAATTAFIFHLTGLGLEYWDYTQPEYSDDDCIKSIWRMVCFTYFPRSAVGCTEGVLTQYLRPCQSSCMNYVRACSVECCDESVQCVFTHTKALSSSVSLTTEGYMPHDGPSSLCTGGARRQASPFSLGLWLVLLQVFPTLGLSAGSMRWLTAGLTPRRLLWVGSLILLAMSLQACDYDVPVHNVGNWRGEPDYLIQNQFIPPGGHANQGALNSCSLERLSQVVQCSGRGVCKMWDQESFDNHLAFCECDRDWADPECRTKRKSQLVAFLLSLFFGPFGADLFYLGFPVTGTLKLLTLGGFGIWWGIDIIRIGSAPVYAGRFKAAADLPHWAFVLTAVTFAMLIGFSCAYVVTTEFRARKRRETLLLQNDEEARKMGEMPPFTASLGPGKQQPKMIAPPIGPFPPFAPSPGPYGSMGPAMPVMGSMGAVPMGKMAPGM